MSRRGHLPAARRQPDKTFYFRKKQYVHIGLSALKKLRLLREKNALLKRLVADLTLDKQILSDVVKKL